MSIVYERVERVVVEDRHPVAVCDGCGRRDTSASTERPVYPKGWIYVALVKDAAYLPDACCSARCLQKYAERMSTGVPVDPDMP